MNGRRLAPLAVLLLLFVLWRHGQASVERWRASRDVAQVEALTLRLSAEGHLARKPLDPRVVRWMDTGLEVLRQANLRDPVEISVPIAEAALYSLLDRPQAAIRAYERALRIEPRPEIFANLGRTRLRLGDGEGARQEFRRAVLLNHNLAKEFRPYLDRSDDMD